MLENLKFEKITDGTPFAYSIANSIVKDSKWFIWFATNLGLVRYDGQNFKLLDQYSDDSKCRKDPGITTLIRAETGNLIFLTQYFKDFVVFDIENEVFTFESTSEDPSSTSFYFYRLAEFSDKEMWIGTYGYGIQSYNWNSKIFSEVQINSCFDDEPPTCKFVDCFFVNKYSEKLYIGTKSEGLVIYDIETRNFRKADIYSGITQKGTTVSIVFRDSEGLIWVGQSNGLFVLDRNDCLIKKFLTDNNSEDSISGNNVTSICEDDQGLIWIGTRFNGLNCYDKTEERFQRINMNKINTVGRFNDSIYLLFKDRTNVIWVGTNYGGFGRFNRDEKHFYILSDARFPKINDIDVHTIYKDHRNSLWLGTLIDGLYKYSLGKENQYELIHFKDLDHIYISCIISDNEDGLWIGCNKFGLIRMSIDTNRFDVVEQAPFLKRNGLQFFISNLVFQDITNSKYLWLAVDMLAMVIFDTETNEFVENKVINETFNKIPVVTIYEDSAHHLWIGTHGSGVFRYDLLEEVLIKFSIEPNSEDNLSNSVIVAIVEDSDGNMWFATNSSGIIKYERSSNRFKRVNIPGNHVCAILLDEDNNLWISSSSSLLKYNVRNDDVKCFVGLNEFNTCSFFKSSDGTMYFGGKNGVTYFKPEEITTNPHIPQIALTDFKILQESVTPSPDNPFLKKSIAYADEITLTHKENVITFEFASLIYNDPKQNQHAYKMEGFDKDWVYCGTRRSATYTNLDPGEYTFRVKGSNEDGLWNEEGTSIKLKISPPWQKTVLFKSLVGLGVLTGLGSIYKKRVKRLNEENLQREEFTKKLIESQENERKRVAAELHDSIGQDLLILKNKLLTSIKKAGDEKYIQQLSELSELTTLAIDDVRQISYDLRPYELDRLGLTKTIESMIERANNFTNIIFLGRLDNIDKTFPAETEINIYRIIQESLNNVIKHSEASKVMVIIRKTETSLQIRVSDNGKGFDIWKYRLNSEKSGFGLKGMQERARLFQGELNIKSSPGKGSKIEIHIPVSAGKSEQS